MTCISVLKKEDFVHAQNHNPRWCKPSNFQRGHRIVTLPITQVLWTHLLIQDFSWPSREILPSTLYVLENWHTDLKNSLSSNSVAQLEVTLRSSGKCTGSQYDLGHCTSLYLNREPLMNCVTLINGFTSQSLIFIFFSWARWGQFIHFFARIKWDDIYIKHFANQVTHNKYPINQ